MTKVMQNDSVLPNREDVIRAVQDDVRRALDDKLIRPLSYGELDAAIEDAWRMRVDAGRVADTGRLPPSDERDPEEVLGKAEILFTKLRFPKAADLAGHTRE